MMKHLITAALFICCITLSQAQQRVSVSLNNAPLISLIETIEQQTPYRFYFMNSWIDSVRVSSAARQATVHEVLTDALYATGIEFFIDSTRVILTQGVRLTDRIGDKTRDTLSMSGTRNVADVYSGQNSLQKGVTLQIGLKGKSYKDSYTIKGSITERESGEALPSVVVRTQGAKQTSLSDVNGNYSIRVPRGQNTLLVTLVGMQTIVQKINLVGDGTLDFKMDQSSQMLNEVVVEADGDANVSGIQMGLSKIDLKSMKNIPKVLGENDMLKVATNLPGVKTIGEGASGINVRGGHADQNLIILNEATIYNVSHFLGFFSVFNPDAIGSFELYKSGIPVQYGGRLSSTLAFYMRDGNDKKFSGQGGIGPVTSHLTLEIPLAKEKTSLMVGGRATYSNWVLNALPESVINKTTASFYDYFGRLTHKANEKNLFALSWYATYDKFSLSSDTLLSYSNKLASFQWHHSFNSKIDGALTATYSAYNYKMDYSSRAAEAFKLGFDVKETNLKWEVTQNAGKHKLQYGIQGRLYDLNPGYLEKNSDSSLVIPRRMESERGIESALFVADNIELSPAISLYYGLRYSLYSALGPRDMYSYADGVPRNDDSVVDSVRYDNNQVIKTYSGPEYRVSLRFKLNEQTSIKTSYNRTRQYIQMLSNTVSVSPTDTWKLSDQYIKPQVGDQVSAGIYRNFKKDMYEVSTELYYKWIDNIIDYKVGATLLVNENIEQQILQGKGKAYGVEFLLKKKTGRVTGWLGYAYSRTFIQLDGTDESERVNKGQFFPANYDKPHEVNLVTNIKITRRYSFSLNTNYSTGRPITYPIAAYRFGNTYRVEYSDRNADRIPDYFRVDLGFNIEGNHKIKKLAHSFWSISIYNLLGRKNPYSVYYRIEDNEIKAYKLSVFGAPIPTIVYHFKF